MGRHFVEMMSSEGNYPIKMSLISGVVFTPFWFEYLFHNDNFQSCWCVYTGMGLKPSQNGVEPTDQNSKPSVQNPEVSNVTVSEKLPVSEVSNATS